jgi:hypothetical protein
MKFTTLATTSSALLAAALMSHADTHDARLPGQAERDAAAPGLQDSTAGARAETGQTTQRAQPTAGERRSSREIAAQFQKWEDAEMSKVEMGDLPESARNGLRTTAAGAEIGEIAELRDEGDKLFVAKLNRENQEETRVFMKEDGTVVGSMRKTEFSSAPQAVQAAVQEEPAEFHLINVDDQTHYLAKMKDGDKTSMVLISNTGEKTPLKPESKESRNDD